MTNPALSVEGALDAFQALEAAASQSDLPRSTIDLVHLRASQINGCSVCVDIHWRSARKSGETDERLFALAAWRESPYFSDAERAALAFTEAATRLCDRADPVPQEIFDAVAAHYDERALSSLILQIALVNAWNRINVASGQISGDWTDRWATGH